MMKECKHCGKFNDYDMLEPKITMDTEMTLDLFTRVRDFLTVIITPDEDGKP